MLVSGVAGPQPKAGGSHTRPGAHGLAWPRQGGRPPCTRLGAALLGAGARPWLCQDCALTYKASTPWPCVAKPGKEGPPTQLGRDEARKPMCSTNAHWRANALLGCLAMPLCCGPLGSRSRPCLQQAADKHPPYNSIMSHFCSGRKKHQFV